MLPCPLSKFTATGEVLDLNVKLNWCRHVPRAAANESHGCATHLDHKAQGGDGDESPCPRPAFGSEPGHGVGEPAGRGVQADGGAYGEGRYHNHKVREELDAPELEEAEEYDEPQEDQQVPVGPKPQAV